MSGRGGGRGAYFKAKYGGGGRGGRGGDGGGGGGGGGGTAQQLQDTLHRLDGKGYKVMTLRNPNPALASYVVRLNPTHETLTAARRTVRGCDAWV